MLWNEAVSTVSSTERIKVNIEDIQDPHRYTQVASLVDRDDFWRDILRLRKWWKMTKLFARNKSSAWEFFPDDTYICENSIKVPRFKNGRHKQLFQKYGSYEGVDIHDLERIMWNLRDLESLGARARQELTKLFTYETAQTNREYFLFQVQGLRRKYKYSPNFDQVIAHALLFGEVKDGDYIDCQIDLVHPNPDNIPYFEDSKLVITFYPLTRLEDITKIFRERKTELIDVYEKEFIGGKVRKYDTKGKIKRDRELYWTWLLEKERGRGVSERIMNSWNQQNEYLDDFNKVDKAVSRYKRFLSSNSDI